MKKVLVLLALFAAHIASAQDNSSISVEAGYNNHYIVNGVSRSEATPFVGVGAVKSLKYADVYLGGTLLANGDLDQSHWFVGSGKSISLFEKVSLRGDATVTRHQAGTVGIPNSTEFGAKLALANPWVTPYVRGTFDIDLDQRGVFVGLQRAQTLPWGFIVTPSAEYGYVNTYKSLSAKINLSRPIGSFVPYAEAGWFDNDFDSSKYKFSTREFSGDIIYAAGLKYTF